MSWIIQSASDGPIIVNDINMTFVKNQIRDVDLYGSRENVEKSNDLKMLIMKGFLKEIRKDPAPLAAATDIVKISENIEAVHQKVQETSMAHAESIQRIEQKQQEMQKEMTEHRNQMVDISEKILSEFRAFSAKHPIEFKTFATAMRNIDSQRAIVAEKIAELPTSGESEADIKVQERILSMQSKKLERNFQNIGKTVSESSGEDMEASIKALDSLNL